MPNTPKPNRQLIEDVEFEMRVGRIVDECNEWELQQTRQVEEEAARRGCCAQGLLHAVWADRLTRYVRRVRRLAYEHSSVQDFDRRMAEFGAQFQAAIASRHRILDEYTRRTGRSCDELKAKATSVVETARAKHDRECKLLHLQLARTASEAGRDLNEGLPVIDPALWRAEQLPNNDEQWLQFAHDIFSQLLNHVRRKGNLHPEQVRGNVVAPFARKPYFSELVDRIAIIVLRFEGDSRLIQRLISSTLTEDLLENVIAECGVTAKRMTLTTQASQRRLDSKRSSQRRNRGTERGPTIIKQAKIDAFKDWYSDPKTQTSLRGSTYREIMEQFNRAKVTASVSVPWLCRHRKALGISSIQGNPHGQSRNLGPTPPNARSSKKWTITTSPTTTSRFVEMPPVEMK